MDFDIKKYVTDCSYPYETTDDKYTMCVVLINDGNECPLRQQSIKSLTIIDNFNNPFHDGVLDILNNNDILEGSNSPELKLLAPGFKLINNGRDFVFVHVSPFSENKTDFLDSPQSITLMFVINKSEDLFINGDKVKRLYLKDYTEEVLSEYVNGFSTSGYAYKLAQMKTLASSQTTTTDNTSTTNQTSIFDINNNLITIEESDKLVLTQMSNTQRSLSTGKSIAFLLRKIFPDCIINTKLWDFGGPEIFYSSTSNETMLDTLNNLLAIHNASTPDNDRCYLDYSFNPQYNDYEWTFYSISKRFEYSNSAFLLEEMEMSLNNIDTIGDKSDSVNLNKQQTAGYAGNTGIIDKFFFSDFTTEENLNNIKTNFLYNYNYIDKEIHIDCETSNIINTLMSFDSNYSFSLFPNTPHNSLQINNKNMKHSINLYPENTNVSFGRNQMLYYLTLLNNAIQIVQVGNLGRKAGYFITVNKKDAPADNQLYNKIIGKYFILNVNHIFIDKMYKTDILAVKPFYNKPPIASTNYIITEDEQSNTILPIRY